MRILVIAPHPDDEVLGCGGAIVLHKKRQDEIYLCIITKAYTPDWSEAFIKNRLIEVARANKTLGIKKTYFLDFPTVKLDTIGQKELNDSLSKVVNQVEPDIVYIPHKGDLNRDHRLVFEASLVAVRPTNSFRIKKILSYETLSETDWGMPLETFVPNVYVDISDTIETKIQAMKAYPSEIKPYPSSRSIELIEVLAKKRGSEAGMRFAEAFSLIREEVIMQ
jgi:LmbE family N-acetylglucosaminyl deacetylase